MKEEQWEELLQVKKNIKEENEKENKEEAKRITSEGKQVRKEHVTIFPGGQERIGDGPVKLAGCQGRG